MVYDVVLDTGTSPMILSFMFDTDFEYCYLNHGVTFNDYAIQPQLGFINLPDIGLTLCKCGLVPTCQVAYTCNCESLTTTSTMVQGYVNLAFTITNLCTPTIFCLTLEEPF